MKNIQVTSKLLRECKEFLSCQGLDPEKMTHRKILEGVISMTLYGTPRIDEGRDRAKALLHAASAEGEGYYIKGQVLKWAEGSQVFKDGGAVDKKPGNALTSAIVESMRDVDRGLEIDVGDLIVNLDVDKEEEKRERVFTKAPPWEQMDKYTMEEIKKQYPRHPIYHWMERDELKEIAVLCAFKKVPRTYHGSAILSRVANSLYDHFIAWKENKKSNKDEK